MNPIRTGVIAGVIAAAVMAVPPVAAQPALRCPEGQIIVDRAVHLVLDMPEGQLRVGTRWR